MIQRLKPYPACKDSGVEWLGAVPDGWQVSRVKRTASAIVELDRSAVTPERYLALEHVEGWTGRVTTGDDAPDGSQLKRFRQGDVLFGKLRPYLAKVTMAQFDGRCVGEFLVLRPTRIQPVFLERTLRSRGFIDAVTASTDGARMPRAEWGEIGSLGIPVPPEEDQAAIVRYLDHIDSRIQRFIAAKERLIELLEEEKQAIIRRAVTRGLDPDVRLRPSGVDWLGDVPEHWEVKPLAAVLRERGEVNRDHAISEVLSLTRDRGVIPYAEKGNIGNKASEDTARYKIVRPGDIVMNSMNVIIGSVGVSSYLGCLSPVYYVLVPRDGSVAGTFIDAYFRTKAFQRSLTRIGKGILAHRMRVPMGALKREPIPWPPAEEQRAIVNYLDNQKQRVEEAADTAQRHLALLGEYRVRLISDVVTGKLDVREAVRELPVPGVAASPLDEQLGEALA